MKNKLLLLSILLFCHVAFSGERFTNPKVVHRNSELDFNIPEWIDFSDYEQGEKVETSEGQTFNIASKDGWTSDYGRMVKVFLRVEEEQNLPDSPDDAASSTGSDVGTGNFATAATLRQKSDLDKGLLYFTGSEMSEGTFGIYKAYAQATNNAICSCTDPDCEAGIRMTVPDRTYRSSIKVKNETTYSITFIIQYNALTVTVVNDSIPSNSVKITYECAASSSS